MGPIEEYQDRDRKVHDFVQQALSSEARVLRHDREPADSIRGILERITFEHDSFYSLLFDSRVGSVITTIYGTPIPDERNEKVPEDVWKKLRELYITHSQLQRTIGTPQEIVYIGGILECCVANAALYHAANYTLPNQSLFYVPELCVSLNIAQGQEAEEKLSQQNIRPLTHTQAMKLLSRSGLTRATEASLQQ